MSVVLLCNPSLSSLIGIFYLLAFPFLILNSGSGNSQEFTRCSYGETRFFRVPRGTNESVEGSDCLRKVRLKHMLPEAILLSPYKRTMNSHKKHAAEGSNDLFFFKTVNVFVNHSFPVPSIQSHMYVCLWLKNPTLLKIEKLSANFRFTCYIKIWPTYFFFVAVSLYSSR